MDSRATLKVEIPFTDHAHCIGRQGNQIQSIMSASETHIHFPDGNREANGNKSNQVSISGTIPSIAQAHKAIREILPMSLKFLIPPSHLIEIIKDDYPLFENVRKRFGVSVLPRPYAKTGDVYCIVRGLINQSNVSDATEYLLRAFYGFEATAVKVTCQTEVSEQYHVYLQTRQATKEMSLTSIEQYTHTKIEFPLSSSDPQQNGYLRRTSVTITGSPAQVCQARKFFDLCLPILLTFEISSDKEPTRAQILELKEKFNVTTTVRTRKEKIGKFVTVQTQEYNSEQLYVARSMIVSSSSTLTSPQHPSPIGHERSTGRTRMAKLYYLLRSMNLEKYWPIFERNEISFEQFLSMTEKDFTAIGIETFGARRRMSQAINEHLLASIVRE